MNRFYEASSRALSAAEALLGQIEGDLVMGVFVPGLAGRHFRGKAVEGASRLLRLVDWLDVGAGIASGEEFVGNVGGGGFKDFTALGDVTNVAARLTAKAAAGKSRLPPGADRSRTRDEEKVGLAERPGDRRPRATDSNCSGLELTGGRCSLHQLPT